MSRSCAALIAVLLASCNPASGETTTNVDLTPEQQECLDIYDCRVGCADLWPGGWQPPQEESAAYDTCMADCYQPKGGPSSTSDPEAWIEWTNSLPEGTRYIVDYSFFCGLRRDWGGRAYGPCDDERARSICVDDTPKDKWKEACFVVFWCAADCGEACDICSEYRKHLEDEPTEWSGGALAAGDACSGSCSWEHADLACADASDPTDGQSDTAA